MTCTKLSMLLAALAIPAMSACMSAHATRGGGATGDGGVLASVGGISDADIKRPDLGFFLICTTGVKVKGDVKKEGDKEFVRFSGDQVKEGDACAMEVRAEVKDENYEWYGYEKGQKVPGLLYGSDQQKVAGKALKLTLYKLYAIKDPAVETFSIAADVTFDVADAAKVPADGKAAANLVCGEKDTYPGEYKKTGDKQATLTFTLLKVADFKDKTCERLVIAVDKKEAFSGPAADIKVKDAKKDVPLKFPTVANTRYTLTETIHSNLDVQMMLSNGCVKLEAASCLEFALPYPKNYLVAKLEGKKDGKGDATVYYATAGETGLGLFDGAKLTTEMLNASLKKDAPKTFRFYKATAGDKIMIEGFSADDAKLPLVEADALKREDLDGIVMTGITGVYVHGFHPVSEADLNKRTGATTWMALVKATKADQKEVNLIVTGVNKYFHSEKAPAKDAADKPIVLDLKLLATDMSAKESDHYRVYAFQLEPVAAKECVIQAPVAMINASALNASELQPAPAPDTAAETNPKLDACELGKETLKSLSDYTLKTAAVFSWGWFEAGK